MQCIKNVHCNYIEDGVAGLTGLIIYLTLIKAELHITFNLESFMNCSLIQKGVAEIGDFFGHLNTWTRNAWKLLLDIDKLYCM